MSSNSTTSGKKRARTDMIVCTAAAATNSGMKEGGQRNALQVSGCYDINERTEALSTKLFFLYKEFPEMVFIENLQIMQKQETLQMHVRAAVKKFKDVILKHKESEAKKRKAQALMNHEEKTVPLYSLPDEVLRNCLSFLGKGHFGLVGLASKKLHKAYTASFGKETKYLEMATSINLVNHCITCLCKTSEEKDELFKAAAVNGNLDILRYAVSQGYDLFPLVEMQNDTVYEYEDWTYGPYDEDEHGNYDEYELEEMIRNVVVYYTDEDERQSYRTYKKVKLSQLVARGHLHVLKYLYEELNYCVGLQRYCRPAIQYGKIEILEWLHDIGCMDPGDKMHKFCMDKNDQKCRPFNFSMFAVKCGNVEALAWLLDDIVDLPFFAPVMKEAIRSKSEDMIEYCFDLGYNLETDGIQEAIRDTKSLEVYRKVHDLGYNFKTMTYWYDQRRSDEIKDSFEIIKYLSSVSTQWEEKVMMDFVQYGTLEMIRFAHENGCPWSNSKLFEALLCQYSFSKEKFNYLIEIGCKIEYDLSVVNRLCAKEDLDVLELFVGKNSTLDNAIFKRIVKCDALKPWVEGIAFLVENGKDIQNFVSVEDLFELCRHMDGIKYFHGQGLPWCLDTTRNNLLLCEIACINELDNVKWAYENGCKGGHCVNEEHINPGQWWKENRWKENRTFLQENGIISPLNIQEIGDAELESKRSSRASMFFIISYSTLKSLVDRGYVFHSQSEKELVIKEALEKCMYHYSNSDKRQRLALFQKMGVCPQSSSLN